MNLPTQDQRRTEVARPEALPTGLDAVAHRWQGRWRGRGKAADELRESALRVHAAAETLRHASNHELAELLREGAGRVRRLGARWSEEFEAILPPLVEVADRQLGMRPYPVQIMGALGLGRGRLVEMATGEGKTLTIALAAAPSGWLRRPCHVITANDYLAERDAKALARFYEFCGVRAGFVTATMAAEERAKNYAAEVVYTTSKELVADFLRDRLVLGPLHSAQRRAVRNLLKATAPRLPLITRGLFTAIVDEADNLLIDEAVTPLIISRKDENTELQDACRLAAKVVEELVEDEHYAVDEDYKDVRLTPAGVQRVGELVSWRTGTYHAATWMRELVEQALRARRFYIRGKHYVVQNGTVVIVDEFTGRLMPGRSWRLGLHQAVEAKEGLAISPPTEALARLSFQRFFRLFRRLSGITGTAREAADEFWTTYELPFTSIPPNRPCQRIEWPTLYYRTAEEKWAAIVREIETVHATGRPVLVGTRSVAASESLAERLQERGLAFTILNAVRHKEEAGIILRAGEKYVITIATNMAGRGTDIRIDADVARLGGLHVILTEPHESGRIDRQLQGRSGRQGDPGSTRTFASFEDEVLVRFLPKVSQGLLRSLVGNVNSGWARALAKRAFRRAQRSAERRAQRQRRLVMQQDAQLAESLTMGYADQL
jgi:Preprotein translocase subunit SecA (ATPase, RNA helicase)